MIAVVMAGGEGSRLRPLTLERPKPLVPIANKAVMHHIVDLLRRHGIHDVLATIHYKGEAIESYFGDGSRMGIRMRYVREAVPLGTAGAVGLARHVLQDDTFLVVSGDALTDIDLSALITFHHAKAPQATIAVQRVDDPSRFGVVDADDEGRVVRFQEKPSREQAFSDTVNTGIYVMEPSVLGLIPEARPCDFARDVFPRMLTKRNSLFARSVEGYWSDIGTLDQYKAANEDALHGRVRLELPQSAA
jgi:mannose-1-phosphate guanylyltransferase / phosphomannomutase